MVTQLLDVEYTVDYPGLYCASHRSVYCKHVQEVIAKRQDADYLGEVIGRSLNGRLDGEKFCISLPLYPELCVWETITYRSVFHEMLGPMGELEGPNGDRHKVIYRVLPGESALDLAFSLRQNFEDDDSVQSKLQSLMSRKVVPGRPSGVPRCKSSSHGIRYQKLIDNIFSLETLNDAWDEMQSTVYGALWTYHYHGLCVFCWTKSNTPDAIRVAPDFAVEPASDGDFSDLVPSPTTGRRSDGPPPF